MPPNWQQSSYQCPDCGLQVMCAHGPDGMTVQSCRECEWQKLYDPAADDFAADELTRYNAR